MTSKQLKRAALIVLTLALALTMIVPAFAGGGDDFLANWEGNPYGDNYDLRMNAEAADPYVVYCAGDYLHIYNAAGAFQAGTELAAITALSNDGEATTIDGYFSANRDSDWVTVVGPAGFWTSFALETCLDYADGVIGNAE